MRRGDQKRAMRGLLEGLSRQLGLKVSPQVLGVVAAVLVAIVYGVTDQIGGRGPQGPSGGATPDSVVGRVSGVDGDSFEIEGRRIRLIGIDAPEGPQSCERDGRSWPCGRESARQLQRLVSGRDVRCAVEKEDQHGRYLSVCETNGQELNRWMVENGWAVAYGRYDREERTAKGERRGLWAGTFERPRAWRDRNRGG